MKILAGGKILDNRKKSVWEILIKFSQLNVAARAGLSAGKFLHLPIPIQTEAELLLLHCTVSTSPALTSSKNSISNLGSNRPNSQLQHLTHTPLFMLVYLT